MATLVEYNIASEEIMLNLGGKIAKACPLGSIIYLCGELGVGKTTFTRGFLQKLGNEGYVKSPTYTLVEPYVLDQFVVYHFDLYRIKEAEELIYMGIEDYFDDQSISLIEWPENGVGVLPTADLVCSFTHMGDGRHVKLMAETQKGEQMLKEFLHG